MAAAQPQCRLLWKAALDAEHLMLNIMGRNVNYLIRENRRLKQIRNTNCQHCVLS